eukprot:CAMPEP_0201593654 /NCGR_PEP_ID=MMETSP0190_2-20130828/191197_1 /ASSEMBLY_ACC=CAM_ASM_000263 /TAXON_ID=37353 /ORGANISM="Rosalina sp." /LENGTH=215 /DNA_ID=CAMNT_0048052935 /DNA_START=661 /DNA_END=1308 /DNA_ORIENTATION=-
MENILKATEEEKEKGIVEIQQNEHYDKIIYLLELKATEEEKEKGIVEIQQNEHYDKIIYLLDMYCINSNDSKIFPHKIEHEVNMEKIDGLKDENVENCVNMLHSIFKDIDEEVIKVILMKQCFGNMRDCVEVLCLMTSNKQIDKDKVEKDIDEKNEKEKKFEKEKLVQIAKHNSESHLELSSDEDCDEDKHGEKRNVSKSPSALMLDGLISKFDI